MISACMEARSRDRARRDGGTLTPSSLLGAWINTPSSMFWKWPVRRSMWILFGECPYEQSDKAEDWQRKNYSRSSIYSNEVPSGAAFHWSDPWTWIALCIFTIILRCLSQEWGEDAQSRDMNEEWVFEHVESYWWERRKGCYLHNSGAQGAISRKGRKNPKGYVFVYRSAFLACQILLTPSVRPTSFVSNS